MKYREENGPFTSRKQLLKVPKLGPKAFEQCAGFLRVPESQSVLDNTGVHPESYPAAEKLLDACGCTLDNVSQLKEKSEAIGLPQLAETCGVGVPTLADIIKVWSSRGRCAMSSTSGYLWTWGSTRTDWSTSASSPGG